MPQAKSRDVVQWHEQCTHTHTLINTLQAYVFVCGDIIVYSTIRPVETRHFNAFY